MALISIKDERPADSNNAWNLTGRGTMPTDAVVVSFAVVAVFVAFAVVLAWADRQTGPGQLKSGAGSSKRRSF